jgi:hypothetical protein
MGDDLDLLDSTNRIVLDEAELAGFSSPSLPLLWNGAFIYTPSGTSACPIYHES